MPEVNLIAPVNSIIHTINKDNLFFIHFRIGDYIKKNDINSLIKNIIDKMMIDEINRNYFNNSNIKVTSLQLNN